MTPNTLLFAAKNALFAAKNALLNAIAVADNGVGESELTC